MDDPVKAYQRRVASLGGKARAQALSRKRRQEIGRMGGAAARRYWEEIRRVLGKKD